MADPPAAVSHEQALLSALEGQIPRVRVRWSYQLGLVAVTLMMLLLPLIYLGMIGLVAYGVVWHATHDVGILGAMRPGRGSLVLLFIYVLPIILGAMLVAFMVKPLFAKRTRQSPPVPLSRVQERLLYTFVDKLCGIVGSRKPTHILVDCQVNASASFCDGMLGLLTGKLILTIGLPLAAGMNARQLTGVLAHEFGHFSQGTGMRLTFIVRSINAWFARVALERDAWDEMLADAAKSNSHWTINVVAWLATLMVWLTRRVLWALMWAGHFVSSFMLRQMEFDADRYEAVVSGSEAFAGTSERVALLSVAQGAAMNDLAGAWREKRLCDDLAGLIVSRERSFPAELRGKVRKLAGERKTGWFDSHPCDADRNASALREGAAGIFRLDLPATVLFNDFAGLSRRTTELFYRENIGDAFKPAQLVTTNAMVVETTAQQAAQQSLSRFFQGLVHPVRPVFPDRGMQIPEDAGAIADLMLQARNRLLERAPAARKAAEGYQKADTQFVGALQAQTMRTAGVPAAAIPMAELGMVGHGHDHALSTMRTESEGRRASTAAIVSEAVRDAMTRINIALAMAERERRQREPATTVPVDGEYGLAAEAAGSGDRIVDALMTLSAASPGLERVRREFLALGAALALCKPQGNPASLVQVVLGRAKELQALLLSVHGILRGAAYPYGHADGEVTISRYAAEKIPGAEEVVAVYHAAEATLDASYDLYVRLMSDLARRAEEVEREMGLEPLPEVAEAEGVTA